MKSTPTDRKPRSISLGAAHTNPADAYKGVPILKLPVWHNEVAAYFFFGGISAGSAIIGSLAEVFGGERYKQLARTAHYVSFATLLPCPPLLVADLGRPERFHHMMRIFKPSSPMNLGSWALLVHGAGATATVAGMLAVENKLPIPVVGRLGRLFPEKVMAALGVPSALVLGGYTGVLLGTTSNPVWYTSQMLGGLFMASSLGSGAAAISLADALSTRGSHGNGPATRALGIGFDAVELALLGGYVATTGAARKHLLAGKEGRLVRGAAAALGISLGLHVVSAVLPKSDRLLGALSGAVGLVGAAMLRSGVVSAGRRAAADREGTLEAMKPRKGSPGWRVTGASQPV
ncbi:MAG: polysulfide reductase NrfD [Chloroflexota bacterium]|nr:polysulfide reductase NrfD [Chloroflexota bacterium]